MVPSPASTSWACARSTNCKQSNHNLTKSLLLTILAHGWTTSSCFKMVAPSFVIVTSPFGETIYCYVILNNYEFVPMLSWILKSTYHLIHTLRTKGSSYSISNTLWFSLDKPELTLKRRKLGMKNVFVHIMLIDMCFNRKSSILS